MEEESLFKKEIKSNKNHLFSLEIKMKENNLHFIASFTDNYIIYNYLGNFSLDELQKSSNYYKQFTDIKMLIKEIEEYKGDKKILLDEKNDEINIKFPIGSAIFKEIDFNLKLKPKSDKEKIEEYEKAFQRFLEDIKVLIENIQELKEQNAKLKNRFIIPGLKSKIIPKDNFQKEIIKMWISPFKDISAQLIYSFNFEYKEPIKSNKNNYDDLTNFHKACDNKTNVLVICKSKKEIFGGFTPLSFLSDSSYGYDNDSFIFSFNNLKKYSKNNQDKDTSIWRYAEYGPCFSYDLNFKNNTMNKVKFEKYNYAIPDNIIDKNNVNVDNDGWILLESIEIYQINFNNIFKI